MVGSGQLGDVVTDVAVAGAKADVANQREIPQPTASDDLTRLHNRHLTPAGPGR
jgi:hypothetical protein